MKQIETKKDYQNYVDQKTPNSPIWSNILKAFIVGGFICLIGQFILDGLKSLGLDEEQASSVTSISLIFLGILLTTLNIYNKIGKFAGAGSIVPITRICEFNSISGNRIQK